MAAIAVVNATGDVLDADGGLIAGPRDGDGRMLRSVEMFAAGHEPAGPPPERQSTTLACVLTDAGLDKLGCAKVARMASAGIARAVDPVFTPFDGDVVFCLADGEPRDDPVAADPGRLGRRLAGRGGDPRRRRAAPRPEPTAAFVILRSG